MVLLICCVVHPIDVAKHPTVPPGYRWAVMVGSGPASEVDRCANAGWTPDADSAEAEGDQNAATATRVLRMLGANVRYGGVLRLDHDPIPPGRDRVHIV